jgi:hypothetical protein
MAKKKRTKAQRSAAAKESWERRRAAAALAAVPKFNPRGLPLPAAKEFLPVPAVPPVTISVTKEGADYYVGINNNGSLHRVRVAAETLKSMALDALRII